MKIDSSTGTHAGGPGNCEAGGVRSRKPGDRKSVVERAQGLETRSKEIRDRNKEYRAKGQETTRKELRDRKSGVESSGTGKKE
jgi:hypothetical protein